MSFARVKDLFGSVLEEFVLRESRDQEGSLLSVHFLEGVFVAVYCVAGDVEFVGGLCLVHARNRVYVLLSGFSG